MSVMLDFVNAIPFSPPRRAAVPPEVASRALDELEDEAIFVIREVTAERERPVLLFSGGKDSILLLHLAKKAFAPARIPFPVLHVDTGHNFPEVIEARDRTVKRYGVRLLVASVEEAIARGRAKEDTGPRASRNKLQIPALLDALAEHRFDAAFGGARRDEERARAKERIVSVRDKDGRWDPRNQRPELWDLFNTRIEPGEQLRVFPLSNFTELDVWSLIGRDHVELPSIYYAHERQVFLRDGMLYDATTPFVQRLPGETPFTETVRFRTVGDATCTGAVRSTALTVSEVLAELELAEASERGATRADDRAGESAMEDRKRQGYF